MAESYINALSGDFEPEEFTDEYRGALEEVIEAKVAGREVVAPDRGAGVHRAGRRPDGRAAAQRRRGQGTPRRDRRVVEVGDKASAKADKAPAKKAAAKSTTKKAAKKTTKKQAGTTKKAAAKKTATRRSA